MNDNILVRFLCENKDCRDQIIKKKNRNPNFPKLTEWEGVIKKHQLTTTAIWFHSMHEGHLFSYWEDDELILGNGKVLER